MITIKYTSNNIKEQTQVEITITEPTMEKAKDEFKKWDDKLIGKNA